MPSRHRAAGRPKVKLVVAIFIAALALYGFGAARPAAAKGPVSATVTGPGINEPIELVDQSAGVIPEPLVRLMEQSGLFYVSGRQPRPVEPPEGDLGPSYTLTWVNAGPPHLPEEERTIRQVLYLEAGDGPLIHTPDQDALQGWGSDVAGWFAAPEGFRDTLMAAGVPPPESSSLGRAFWAGLGDYWYLALAGLVLVGVPAWRWLARRGMALAES